MRIERPRVPKNYFRQLRQTKPVSKHRRGKDQGLRTHSAFKKWVVVNLAQVCEKEE